MSSAEYNAAAYFASWTNPPATKTLSLPRGTLSATIEPARQLIVLSQHRLLRYMFTSWNRETARRFIQELDACAERGVPISTEVSSSIHGCSPSPATRHDVRSKRNTMSKSGKRCAKATRRRWRIFDVARRTFPFAVSDERRMGASGCESWLTIERCNSVKCSHTLYEDSRSKNLAQVTRSPCHSKIAALSGLRTLSPRIVQPRCHERTGQNRCVTEDATRPVPDQIGGMLLWWPLLALLDGDATGVFAKDAPCRGDAVISTRKEKAPDQRPNLVCHSGFVPCWFLLGGGHCGCCRSSGENLLDLPAHALLSSQALSAMWAALIGSGRNNIRCQHDRRALFETLPPTEK